MNTSKSMPRTSLALAISMLFLIGGCAIRPHKDSVASSHLFQMSDEYWVDLTDVREIQFQRPDPAAVANGGPEAFSVTLWRNGSDNFFAFSFSDQPSAYAAYKRLVAHLGGKLEETRWTLTPATQPATMPAIAASDVPSAENSGDYFLLRTDLAELAACRDEGLITSAEYQRGHGRAISNFTDSVARRNPYSGYYHQFHRDLGQLEHSRKDHLLSDANIAAMRATILARYNLAPDQNQ